MNIADYAKYSVSLLDLARHAGISDIKIHHRYGELVYLQEVLSKESQQAISLLKTHKWNQFENYVGPLIKKSDDGEGSFNEHKTWVLWATDAMMRAYDENELFNVQSLVIRYYETYRHFLYEIALSKGKTVSDHTSLDDLMKLLHFDDEAIKVATFSRKLRNDIVHNRGLIRTSTVEAYSKIENLKLMDDQIYEGDIDISLDSYINLFRWMCEKFDSTFDVDEDEKLKEFERINEEKYPDNPDRKK